MLTSDQVNDIFLRFTFQLLGYPYNDPSSIGHNLIRQAYQPDSQPFNEICDDVVYMFANVSDDIVNRQIDRTTDSVSQRSVISTNWAFYGRSSQNYARLLKMKLFTYDSQYYLEEYGFALITDVPDPITTFENIGGRWWMRTDVIASFNHVLVENLQDTGKIEVADFQINTKDWEYTFSVDIKEE